MIVYLIKKSNMGGSKFLEDAYVDLQAASLFCKDKTDEFTSYHPEPLAKKSVIDGSSLMVVYTN